MDDNRDLEELLAEIEADAKEKYGADGAGIISKLRSDLRHERKESARLSAENADLRARLEQAERERDAARADLERAQGFPDTYQIDLVVDGRPLSKADQVRMCGNSVCPPIAAAIVRANYVQQQADVSQRRRAAELPLLAMLAAAGR